MKKPPMHLERPMPKRDSAGSMKLTEGDGELKRMISCGTFLEAYKPSSTFQIRTPDGIDPNRTNDDVPWTSTHFPNFGSSNPIIARLMIGAHDLLQGIAFKSPVDKEAIQRHMHGLKELLLACHSIEKRIDGEIRLINVKLQKDGLSTDMQGRAITNFPQVSNLITDAQTFLNQANRAIRQLATLPNHFLPLKSSDSNFTYLGKHLSEHVAPNSGLLIYIEKVAVPMKRIVDLRNFDEHQTSLKTVIKNIAMRSDASLRAPEWGLEGQELSTINEEMREIVLFLTDVAESVFVLLLQECMLEHFPMRFYKVDPIDPDCPVQVRVTLEIQNLVTNH